MQIRLSKLAIISNIKYSHFNQIAFLLNFVLEDSWPTRIWILYGSKGLSTNLEVYQDYGLSLNCLQLRFWLICLDRPGKTLILTACYAPSLSQVWLSGIPWTVCSPARLLCLWNFPGKNTGVGCHFLFQRIFPAQELNLCLLSGRFFTTVPKLIIMV